MRTNGGRGQTPRHHASESLRGQRGERGAFSIHCRRKLGRLRFGTLKASSCATKTSRGVRPLEAFIHRQRRRNHAECAQ